MKKNRKVQKKINFEKKKKKKLTKKKRSYSAPTPFKVLLNLMMQC